jgi:hypothetical protein
MLAVEFDRARDHDIAELDVGADAAARAGGDEHLRLDRRRDLGHQLADRDLRSVIVEVQARFEQKDTQSPDLARKVKAKAVIVARHFGTLVVEGRLRARDQRYIACYVVAVFIPFGGGVAGGEQRRHCGGFGRGPGHDNRVVALELGKVSVLGGRLGKWSRGRPGAGRPGHGRRQRRLGYQNVFRKPHRSKPGVRFRRVEIEDDVVDVERMSHNYPRRASGGGCGFRPLEFSGRAPQPLHRKLGRVADPRCDRGHSAMGA